MGRWTQYDEDDYRLPEGMKRVGYDADTQTYIFKDSDGSLWIGAEGAEFGELKRVETSGPDLEASREKRVGVYEQLPAGESAPPRSTKRDAFRTLLPFLLIVVVFLLLVFRLFSPISLSTPHTPVCPEHSRPYEVRVGDTCWKIAQAYASTLESLRAFNPSVDCAMLVPGQRLCVPVKD